MARAAADGNSYERNAEGNPQRGFRSHLLRFISCSFPCSRNCFEPASVLMAGFGRPSFRWFIPLLQILIDDADFEQNAAVFDTLAQGFKLRGSDCIWAVGNVQQHTFKFVQGVGHALITVMQRGLAIQAIFVEQAFGATLGGGDVDDLLAALRRWRVFQFHQHHFGAAQMFTDGDDQHTFAHFAGVNCGDAGFGALGDSSRKKRQGNHCCQRAYRQQTSGGEESGPPVHPGRFFRKARRDLLPHALAVVFTRIGNRHSVERGEDTLNARHFLTTFAAFLQMRGNLLAVVAFAVSICDQFFFL